MFQIWRKSKWKAQARLKLDARDIKMSDEYRAVLTNQSKGRCVSCSTGKIKSFITDKNKNINIIEFSCGHKHTEVFINETLSVSESIKALVVPDGKGKRHFTVRYVLGWFSSINSELTGGVFKEQLIDRRNNKYVEKVINALNKKDIIKNQEQSLSEHRGYGSTRIKK